MKENGNFISFVSPSHPFSLAVGPTNYQVPEYRGKVLTVCSTNTWPTVLDGSVRAREFTKVVTCHFGLDFDRVEDLWGAPLQ